MESGTRRAGPPLGVRASWRSLDTRQRRTLLMMTLVILGLTIAGFVTLIAVVAPERYHLGSTGAFTIGIGVTAYTLGMRHAFDADHIAAIDNTTRKLMAEGKRPAERRLLVLARPLDDRVRARVPALDSASARSPARSATTTPRCIR